METTRKSEAEHPEPREGSPGIGPSSCNLQPSHLTYTTHQAHIVPAEIATP
jgi:hypothetical protein